FTSSPCFLSFPTRRSSDLYPLCFLLCSLLFLLVILLTCQDRLSFFNLLLYSIPATEFTIVSNSSLFKGGSFLSFHIYINSATSRSEEHTSELQSRFALVCR